MSEFENPPKKAGLLYGSGVTHEHPDGTVGHVEVTEEDWFYRRGECRECNETRIRPSSTLTGLAFILSIFGSLMVLASTPTPSPPMVMLAVGMLFAPTVALLFVPDYVVTTGDPR